MTKRFALLLLVISFFVLSFAQISVRSDSLKQNCMICSEIGESSQPKQTINIGCKLSCNSWTPIIVMNGILSEKSELKNINPDDIKSITVLKGPALGCYGPASKFGVIVIETKTFDKLVLKSNRKMMIRSGSLVKYSKKIINSKKNFNNDVKMKIYPNPLRGSQSLNINFISKKEERVQINLFTLEGKLIKSLIIAAIKGENKFQFPNETNLPAATYLVQVMNKSGVVIFSEKLVVQ